MSGPEHVINKRPHQCKLCSKSYARSNGLMRHEKAAHEDHDFIGRESFGTVASSVRAKDYSRIDILKQYQQGGDSWVPSYTQPNQQTEQFGNASYPTDEQYPLPTTDRSTIIAPKDNQYAEFETQQLAMGQPCVTTAVTNQNELQVFYCCVCDARRHDSSLLYHLLDHLESIIRRDLHCQACCASFGLSDHLIAHKNNCQWPLDGRPICPRICIEGFSQTVFWGCDARHGDFNTDQERTNHCEASDDSQCSLQRRKILGAMAKKVLAQLQAHMPSADIQVTGNANIRTLGIVRQEVHRLEANRLKEYEMQHSLFLSEHSDFWML
jgi:hypothetical protein